MKHETLNNGEILKTNQANSNLEGILSTFLSLKWTIMDQLLSVHTFLSLREVSGYIRSILLYVYLI